MIQMRCPRCGGGYPVHEALSGLSVRCPRCHHWAEAPEVPRGAVAAAPDRPVTNPLTSPAPPPAASPLGEAAGHARVLGVWAVSLWLVERAMHHGLGAWKAAL